MGPRVRLPGRRCSAGLSPEICCDSIIREGDGAEPVLVARLGLTRRWLLSVRLSFLHRAAGAVVRFDSLYAQDLARTLDVLRGEG